MYELYIGGLGYVGRVCTKAEAKMVAEAYAKEWGRPVGGVKFTLRKVE